MSPKDSTTLVCPVSLFTGTLKNELKMLRVLFKKSAKFKFIVKPHQHTCSKCFSPSSSSVSCITVLGLLIGASTLDEKGRGLVIATGISTGFCGGNWTEGEGADFVVNREQQILGVFLNVKSKCHEKKS